MTETNTAESQQSEPEQVEEEQQSFHNVMERSPAPSPGLLLVTVDTIITNFHQLGLTVTDVLVILTSFTYNGDDLGWIILSEILILLISFAFYIKYICKHILIWDKFFRKIDGWYSRQYALSQNDSHCRRLVFINIVWWLYAVLIFPVIIIYSAYLSYKYYKNKRSNTNTDVSTIDFDSSRDLDVSEQNDYIKHSFNTFSVSYLGVLSKQASCLMCFIQDIPLLIISLYITNYIGIIVFIISILWKLINWIKYMYDVRGCRCFYKFEDFWPHFDLADVRFEPLEDIEIEIPVAVYYTDIQKYKNRLKLGDFIKVLNEDKDEWVLAIVYKNYYYGKNYDLIALEWDKIDHNQYQNGGNYVVPEEAVMRLNRMDDTVQPLNDEELQSMGKNDDDDNNNDEKDNEEIPVQITMQQTHDEKTTELEINNNDESADNTNYNKKNNNDNNDHDDDGSLDNYKNETELQSEENHSKDDENDDNKDNHEIPIQITTQQNKDDLNTDNNKDTGKAVESTISSDDQQETDLMKDNVNEDDQLIGDTPVIVDEMDEKDYTNKNVNNHQSASFIEDNDDKV